MTDRRQQLDGGGGAVDTSGVDKRDRLPARGVRTHIFADVLEKNEGFLQLTWGQNSLSEEAISAGKCRGSVCSEVRNPGTQRFQKCQTGARFPKAAWGLFSY